MTCKILVLLGLEAVKRPRHGQTTTLEGVVELQEDLLGHVNVVELAAHALVLDGGGGSLAVGGDGDCLAAHGVPVGLGAHEEVGDGHDVVRLVGVGVVLAAGAEAKGVVGELAGAGATAAGGRVAAGGVVSRILVLLRRGLRRRRGRSRGGGLRLRLRGGRGRSLDRGGRLRGGRRRGRCLRGGGGLRGRRLEELAVSVALLLSRSRGGRSRLLVLRGDQVGGGGINDGGHRLDLGDPFDLCDHSTAVKVGGVVPLVVVVAVATSGVRLRGSNAENECEDSGLHCWKKKGVFCQKGWASRTPSFDDLSILQKGECKKNEGCKISVQQEMMSSGELQDMARRMYER